MSEGIICQHTGCRQYARWRVSSKDLALESDLCNEHAPGAEAPVQRRALTDREHSPRHHSVRG